MIIKKVIGTYVYFEPIKYIRNMPPNYPPQAEGGQKAIKIEVTETIQQFRCWRRKWAMHCKCLSK